MYTILLVTHSIIVLFLIVLILIQRNSGDGLSGLGGGGNQFLTGRAQANLLTRTTAILAGAFFITSLTLAIMGSHMTASSIVDTVVPPPLETPAAPAETKGQAPAAAAVAKDKAVEKKAAPAPAVPKPE